MFAPRRPRDEGWEREGRTVVRPKRDEGVVWRKREGAKYIAEEPFHVALSL